MTIHIIPSMITDYTVYLYREERSANTITKYKHDIRALLSYMGDQDLSKEVLLSWKETLMQSYAPASVNSMLAAVNGFLDWLELPQFKVKPVKIQRAVFAKPEKELSRREYTRLVQAAKKKQNMRLALVLQTICATGIRVSELRYITVRAIQTGRAVVDCKGKTRTIFLANDLCRSLARYCRQCRVKEGMVFTTSGKKALDRSNIWRDMRSLCESAGVEPEKVFPHNLRHLFARTYYSLEKDLSRLADLLGHSCVSTTKIYTMESGAEHRKQLERMGLTVL